MRGDNDWRLWKYNLTDAKIQAEDDETDEQIIEIRDESKRICSNVATAIAFQ